MEVKVSTKTLQLSAGLLTVCSHYWREIFVQLITPMKFQSDVAAVDNRRQQPESAERGGADLRGGRRGCRQWALLRKRGGAHSPRSGHNCGGATVVQAHSPQSQFGRSAVWTLHRFVSRVNFDYRKFNSAPPAEHLKLFHPVFPGARRIHWFAVPAIV